MKKIMIFILLSVLLSLAAPARAAGTELYYDGEYHTYTGSVYTLYVNGEKITPPLEPIIFNNRALVPLREVFEALGQSVDYNNDTKEITVAGALKTVKLTIGSGTAYINGEKTTIPDGVVPKLITKVGVATKTMVPVRFISDSLGLSVEFDEAAGAIKISEKKSAEQITISAPKITKTSDTVSTISLTLSAPMQNPLKTALTSAGVLYFDVENAKYTGASKTEASAPGVSSVRLGLHDGYTRVAVDLKDYLKYDVQLSADKKSVTITVTAKEGSSGENSTPTTPQEPTDNSTDDAVSLSFDVASMMNYTPSAGVKYVVIDAGHGGSDPGTSGTLDGTTYQEKAIALSVAKLVQQKLEASGIKVIMTRTGDTYPQLSDRSALANKNDAAMFVSIHVNSAASAPNANGIEVYYASENNNNFYGLTSKTLATSILNKMLSETGARSRGVKTERHLVTRTSLMPAVLVEIGFASNSEELKNMISADYQNRLASGIAAGISENLSKVTVPDRKTLAIKKAAAELGEEKATEYINKVWK